MEITEYLTVQQATELLKCTRQEVVRKIWRGSLKAELLGRMYIIHKSEIQRYLRK